MILRIIDIFISLREGLWYISKKLIELESMTTTEDNGSLYHENSFGQTPTDIIIQLFLNTLVSPPESNIQIQVKEDDKESQLDVENSAKIT